MTAPRIARTCRTCGREFTVTAARLHRYPAKYCSQRCWGAAHYEDGPTPVDNALTREWERLHLAPDPATGRRCWPAPLTQEQRTLIGDDSGWRPYHRLDPRRHPDARDLAHRRAAARGGFVLAALDVAEARGVMLVPSEEAAK